jgi:choloylglycine hydrolase
MCTNFKIKPSKDGTVVVGRTMEFPDLIPWEVQVVAAGVPRASAGVKNGLAWTPQYGIVGMGAMGEGLLADGMNTEGLSAHALYMAGFCDYAAPAGTGNDISEMDVIAYLLGTCKNVAEAKSAAAALNVVGVDPGVGFVPPLHFLLHDATASIAIEFRPEGMSIVDNPTGVGTNPPFLDWHVTNLRNYVGISAVNPTTTVHDTVLHPLGQGGGLLGLPGDYTPPSRFVRAAALMLLIDQPADAASAEAACLHVLNSFDIPAGLISEEFKPGQMVPEVTSWVTVCNLTDRRYGYRTVGDPVPYVVDLPATDFSTSRRTPVPGAARFTPVTL